MAADALIGYSGFVGSSLLRQRAFDARFRSTDIAGVANRSFGLVVCAGAPAQKWIANREPVRDRAAIDALIAHLRSLVCESFVLISTIDVFSHPIGVDEQTPVDESGLHAYGLNRRMLEKFVAEHFPQSLVVRLPGLVGPGLRKNVIYDILNDHNLDVIDSRSVFQFYPMVNLWSDIETALRGGLRLLHLTAEPVSVGEVAREGFARSFAQHLAGTPAHYDMRTRHAALFGTVGAYQYSRRESLLAVRAYAQSEARAAGMPRAGAR